MTTKASEIRDCYVPPLPWAIFAVGAIGFILGLNAMAIEFYILGWFTMWPLVFAPVALGVVCSVCIAVKYVRPAMRHYIDQLAALQQSE